MKYVKKVKIYIDGIWNMADVITEDSIITGNWNELKFRNEVFEACNGWTLFNDTRL